MKPVEILLTCPWCKTPNYSERGLRGHVCRSAPGGKRRQLSAPAIHLARKAAGLVKPRLPLPLPSTTPVSMAKTNTVSALALIGSSELKADSKQLALLQASAAEQFRRLRLLREEEALRGLLLGLTLHRVKASLPHGQFGKWSKAQATFGERWVNYLMKLALVFIDKAKATKPELLACPGDQTELTLDTLEGEQRRFVQKATKFVGKHSLAELLDLHGIKETKKLGGKRTAGCDDDDSEETKATPEQLTARAREDLAQFVTLGRQLLIADNVCQHLTPADVKAFDSSLKALCAEWRASLKKTLGEAEAA